MPGRIATGLNFLGSSHDDAPLDWGDMAYDFGLRREAVAMDRHLEDALA